MAKGKKMSPVRRYRVNWGVLSEAAAAAAPWVIVEEWRLRAVAVPGCVTTVSIAVGPGQSGG